MRAEVVSTIQLLAGCALLVGGAALYFALASFLTSVGGVVIALVGFVLIAFRLAKLRWRNDA